MANLKHKKVAFLGAGNMAEALVKGLLAGAVCSPADLRVTDVSADRLGYFERTFGIAGWADNKEAVEWADVVVLAVKPQVLMDVLKEAAPHLNRQALVVSIAAGIPTGKIEKALGDGMRVIRAMPNTPALVRKGVAALCGGQGATEEDLALAEELLRAVGETVRVEEEDMDAVTALSGSGPAYVFFLMEAMLAAAERLGLPSDLAWKLVARTVEGSAELILQTGESASELRRRVTSKGGTTSAALAVLEQKEAFQIVVEAVRAAHRRARELSAM